MKKENITKFYLNYRLYIFPIVVALSCITLIGLIIYPQAVSLIKNNKVVDNFQVKAKFLESKAQTLESYDEVDLKQKVNFALNSYPADRDFANIVGLIQNLAAQSGFTIVSLTLGSSDAKLANQQSYLVKAEVLGPKILVSNLIKSIENSLRIMRVNSVELSSGKDPNTLDVVVEIAVIYSPIPNNFGTADSPLPEVTKKDQELLVKLSGSAQIPQLSTTPTQLPARGKANPFE